MAFKTHTVDDGRIPPMESMPAGDITPEIGMALKLESGKLAIAKGAERPSYISMAERKTACKDGEIIPVIRIGPDIVWETAASVAMTGVKPGDKVTLSADGMSVTAAKGGAAEIVSLDGTEAGSLVRVRFGAGCTDCE